MYFPSASPLTTSHPAHFISLFLCYFLFGGLAGYIKQFQFDTFWFFKKELFIPGYTSDSASDVETEDDAVAVAVPQYPMGSCGR